MHKEKQKKDDENRQMEDMFLSVSPYNLDGSQPGSEQVMMHRRVSQIRKGPIKASVCASANQSDIEQPVANAAITEAESWLEQSGACTDSSRMGTVQTVMQDPASMSFVKTSTATNVAQHQDQEEEDYDYGSESYSDDEEEECKGLDTLHKSTASDVINSLKSSSVIDYDKAITVQVTFRGNIVPIAKKA